MTTGPDLELPEALRAVGPTVPLPGPGPVELRDLLRQVVRDVPARRIRGGGAGAAIPP